jgi:hypothetical protein
MRHRIDPQLALRRALLVFLRSIDEARRSHPFQAEADHARYGRWVAEQSLSQYNTGRKGWKSMSAVSLNRLRATVRTWENQ